MRWRDFSRLVLEAMELRGLQRIPSAYEENQDHSSSFILSGEGKRQLLACKHGSAYRIGSAAVDEFASEVRLRGAQGGILVTEGVLDNDGLERAGKHNIEIIDGPKLWPAVRPMVEGKLQRRIIGNASARARRHIAIAWLGSVTLGLATALTLPSVLNPARDNAVHATPVAAPATAMPSIAPSPKAATTTVAPVVTSEADTEKHRAEISRKLANIPGISRGVWISRSTLAVDRLIAEQDAWALVCRQLHAYPELALTRVQMNPPPGSADQVRWRQCTTP
jgi:hypothetical protein